MSFTPYLHFQGNCAEAMRFYAEVFGATDLQIHGFGDVPADVGGVPGSDRVMHASLSSEGTQLMASDFPPGMEGDPQKAVSVFASAKTAEEGAALFARLMQDGAIIMAYAPVFWSPGFGMGRDRFGTHWMVSVPQT